MLKSEIEKFINEWFLNDKKIFKTYNYFSLDYISIKKEDADKFVCQSNSTSDMGTFTKDELLRLISINIFEYMPFENGDTNLRNLRSGHCTCGGYRLNPPSHAFNCFVYKP